MTPYNKMKAKEVAVRMLQLELAEHKLQAQLRDVKRESRPADVYVDEYTVTMPPDAADQDKLIDDLRNDVADRDDRIVELKRTYDEMYTSMLDANLKTMDDLESSRNKNIKQGKALREANDTLHKAKNVVEGLEAEVNRLRKTIEDQNEKWSTGHSREIANVVDGGIMFTKEHIIDEVVKRLKEE